jgi:hypothetical protein
MGLEGRPPSECPKIQHPDCLDTTGNALPSGKMGGMDGAKIADAVQNCVACARESNRPFREVTYFLLQLENANWAANEVVEVQSRVLKELGHRNRSPDAESQAGPNGSLPKFPARVRLEFSLGRSS